MLGIVGSFFYLFYLYTRDEEGSVGWLPFFSEVGSAAARGLALARALFAGFFLTSCHWCRRGAVAAPARLASSPPPALVRFGALLPPPSLLLLLVQARRQACLRGCGSHQLPSLCIVPQASVAATKDPSERLRGLVALRASLMVPTAPAYGVPRVAKCADEDTHFFSVQTANDQTRARPERAALEERAARHRGRTEGCAERALRSAFAPPDANRTHLTTHCAPEGASPARHTCDRQEKRSTLFRRWSTPSPSTRWPQSTPSKPGWAKAESAGPSSIHCSPRCCLCQFPAPQGTVERIPDGQCASSSRNRSFTSTSRSSPGLPPP